MGMVIDDDFVFVDGSDVGIVSEFWLIPKLLDIWFELKISSEPELSLLIDELAVTLTTEEFEEFKEEGFNDDKVDKSGNFDSNVFIDE